MAELVMKEIMTELKAIRKDLDYIKAHVEVMSLTPEEEEALAEAEKEYREGKAVSLEDFKKEIGD